MTNEALEFGIPIYLRRTEAPLRRRGNRGFKSETKRNPTAFGWVKKKEREIDCVVKVKRRKSAPRRGQGKGGGNGVRKFTLNEVTLNNEDGVGGGGGGGGVVEAW